MLDRVLLTKLDEACGRLAAAEAEVREICRQIAADGGPAAEPGEQERPTLKLARQGRQATAQKRTKGPRVPKEPGQVNKPWIKVVCPRCSAVTGARVVGDKQCTCAHNGPDGKLCPGYQEEAELATPEQIAAAKRG